MAPIQTVKDVEKLSQIERVRQFTTRYLGEDVYTTAAREIIDNAGDEVGRGFATRLHLTFHPDGSIEVCDDGRGLAFDFDAEMITETGSRGANGIVKSLGTLGAGGNYSKASGSGNITAGVHGEGGAATNAICRRMDVTVYSGGKLYRQQFHEGMPGHFAGDGFDPDATFTIRESEKLKGAKAPKSAAPIPGSESGTSVRFLMDYTLAPDKTADLAGVVKRTNIAARLREGMKLTVTGPSADGGQVTEEFTGADGYGADAALAYLAEREIPTPVALTSDFVFTRSGSKIPASVDLAAAPKHDGTVWSVMNTVWTPDGGAYQDAAALAVGEGLVSKQVRGLKRETGEPYPSAEDFAAVSDMVVSVSMAAKVSFTSQEKSKVSGERSMNSALSAAITRKVTMWAASPANAKALLEWATLALNHARTTRKIESAKSAATKASAGGSKGSNLSLPDKFLPCLYTGRGSGSEVHLCEGDSALGTIKAARDARFQAAFPLRGKPINTHGMPLNGHGKIKGCRDNAEFCAIEAILGCGVRENCDPSKCRFDRIILTTDADVDGYNISASLLDMIIENFRPLIEAGMVFIAMPPLFIVDASDGPTYCIDEAARDVSLATELFANGVLDVAEALEFDGDDAAEFAEFLDNATAEQITEAVAAGTARATPSQRPDVQRCKGLGEMSSDDFSETVMDPQTRAMYKASYDADTEARTFDIVFGNSPEARRRWIGEMSGNADLAVAM